MHQSSRCEPGIAGTRFGPEAWLPQARDLRILGIGGSLRPRSCAYLALKYVAGLLRTSGAQVSIFDLRENPLPFCNGDNGNTFSEFPAVEELRARVSRAHALVVATPEYHGGLSGVIKNAFDLLDISHLQGKVVGGISVLGGPHNSNALNDLRSVVRWCHAWMIPDQIAIARAREVFRNGAITDESLEARFRAFSTSLIESALRLNDLSLI